jgi:nucleoid-associated protein EbfC
MDPMDLLKNLKDLQSQMSGVQERLKDIIVQGSAGGGMVVIDMNGSMEVLSVKIAPEVVDPEDITMLEDLVLAACNSAATALREKMSQQAASLAGGAGFPGL